MCLAKSDTPEFYTRGRRIDVSATHEGSETLTILYRPWPLIKLDQTASKEPRRVRTRLVSHHEGILGFWQAKATRWWGTYNIDIPLKSEAYVARAGGTTMAYVL